MSAKEVTSYEQFSAEQEAAGDKMIIVDYFAEWCGPCKQMAPFFARLARRFTDMVFLKVDVDKLYSLAEEEGVSGLPTFIFYLRGRKVDAVRGANQHELEAKLEGYARNSEVPLAEGLKGQKNLEPFIDTNGCECLNEHDDHTLMPMLTKKKDSDAWLESDCDEQLLISVRFKEVVKLHSFSMTGKDGMGPKTVKVFINQSFDFDRVVKAEPTETFTLTQAQVENGEPIALRFVKCQHVHSVLLFVVDNQVGSESTRISSLNFYGLPQERVRMEDFRRVTAKKGETH